MPCADYLTKSLLTGLSALQPVDASAHHKALPIDRVTIWELCSGALDFYFKKKEKRKKERQTQMPF